jgi:hypothetical protein
MNKQDDAHDRLWNDLYGRIVALLRQHGHEDPCGDGDYWVVDDNYGWRRHIVNVFDLKMLDPGGIAAVLPGKEDAWPHMGVTIRRDEIIDGLSRSHLPEPYRSMSIPGRRPGTGYD